MPKNCCHNREQLLQRARRAAEELLERQEELEPSQEEMAMKRYIHPIPCCCPPHVPEYGAGLDEVLEALARQNQLLLDILGAVNALSAAVLSIQSRM